MSISNVIGSRRNIKKFKADELNSEQVKEWLQTSSMAPNHRMTEPWEIIFLGSETRKELNHKTDFGQAPIVMSILSKRGNSVLETNENMCAVACFIQNFMLLAWEEGVGTFWSSIGASEKSRSILSVPENYDVIGVFGVGYPEEIPLAKERAPIESKIKELS